MEDKETLADSFENELEAIKHTTVTDPAFRKKKIILWLIRTILTLVLYVIFWNHNWVKWSLLIIVPLNLFSLFMIIGPPYLLNKRIERTRQKINEADRISRESSRDGE